IGTLITALGCGVSGGQNFALDKLRYHHIIIMTDADVDGSHIRTLLLTFFYRQMPEVIANGYMFIAQPPLYKVTRNKKVSFLKDDEALHRFMIERGADNVALKTANGAITLTGDLVRKLLDEVRRFRTILAHVHRRAEPAVVEAMVRAGKLTVASLKD